MVTGSAFRLQSRDQSQRLRQRIHQGCLVPRKLSKRVAKGRILDKGLAQADRRRL